jgi:hypothetical protein
MASGRGASGLAGRPPVGSASSYALGATWLGALPWNKAASSSICARPTPSGVAPYVLGTVDRRVVGDALECLRILHLQAVLTLEVDRVDRAGRRDLIDERGRGLAQVKRDVRGPSVEA